jgi:hypothetical protein
MPQILFVLTGNGNPAELDRYSAGLLLAAKTVKQFHPEVPIVCLGDGYAEKLLRRHSRLASEIDRFIACPDATGGPVHRSRYIKTTLHRRADGPFVYLDTDVALISDIRDLLECPLPLGLTPDSWFAESIGKFPDWCIPVYRDLHWNIPRTPYYNCGVLFADGSSASRALFDQWHLRHAQSVEIGINLDQPAFNSSIEHTSPQIKEYTRDYNFIFGREPGPVPLTTRILHFCCSVSAASNPSYESAIRSVLNYEKINIADFIERLKNPEDCKTVKSRFLWDLKRRAREFTQRKLFRMRLDSAKRY